MVKKNYDIDITSMAKDIEYIRKSVDQNARSINDIKRSLESNYIKKSDLKFLYGVLVTITTTIVIYVVSYYLQLFNQ